MKLTEQGTLYSLCGEWGCGDHGDCVNGACKCAHGWSGASCATPSSSPPNPNIGDFECGNWGVYGKLDMGRPGLAATCDCAGTDMMGSRCATECEDDADCGTGTCDTSVGRCECSKRCFSDEDCEVGECEDRFCTKGWTGTRCSEALSNKCLVDADCNGQACDQGACVCDDTHTGLRCEVEKSALGASCKLDSDCQDAARHDTCVENTCVHFQTACESALDCRVSCDDDVCALPLAVGETPTIDDPQILSNLVSMIEQMLTPEGIATFASEELVEWALKPTGMLTGTLATRKAILRMRALRSAKVGIAGAPVTKGAMNTILTKLTNTAVRKNVGQMFAKLGSKTYLKGFGILYLMVQVMGMVLDIDDSAGFNAQIPQDGVDGTMVKILKSINDQDDLREFGIQFPREYTPRDTIRYNALLEGDVAEHRRDVLMQDYLNRLDVNSNGVAILRDFRADVPEVVVAGGDTTRNKTLWKLAGKNPRVYTKLKKWWWLMVVLVCVLILTVGLSVGLTARAKHNKR